MNQKKPGTDEIQFKAGVVIVRVLRSIELKNRYPIEIYFLQEDRDDENENKYHGNLFYNSIDLSTRNNNNSSLELDSHQSLLFLIHREINCLVVVLPINRKALSIHFL